MQLYNVEFFTKKLEYVGSQQISSIDLEYDYLSPDENTLNLMLETKCNIDNIICIRSLIADKDMIVGVVTTINETKKGKAVKFKSLLSLFDVPIISNQVETTIEEWLATQISNTYITNEDIFQNIKCLDVKIKSQTYGTFEFDEDIVNLFDYVVNALKIFKISINFYLDFKNKAIIAEIGQNNSTMRVIEADLPNILSKTIELKTSANDNSANKIIIISEDNSITYYKLTDGTLTVSPEDNKRILPVIFSIKKIDCTPEEFFEKAYDVAVTELADDDFNNLIELTVQEEDALINPDIFEIGQKVLIISNNVQYTTYLTGYKSQKGTITLIFGAIRLELTKKLKRRLKK
ncbi:MAG: hypothetical protein KBT03_06115 [Bacteroidales bacterium]|nr:hypothetical protein [Candidatus Scybalousia scybalohippi]